MSLKLDIQIAREDCRRLEADLEAAEAAIKAARRADTRRAEYAFRDDIASRLTEAENELAALQHRLASGDY